METLPNCIPPIVIERNSWGLYTHIDYYFNEHGLIDWRKMIPKEFLIPNKQKTKETDITNLKEEELIILLGGIKYLAQLRGFSDVSYDVVNANEEYASTKCRITWLPNYETQNEKITFEAIAGCSLNNVRDFARRYLIEMAENRAFARAVRSFLRINIVSDKELGEIDQSPTDSTSVEEKIVDARSQAIISLEKLMRSRKLVFDDIKNKLLLENVHGADAFLCVNDIPTSVLLDLILRLKKKEKK